MADFPCSRSAVVLGPPAVPSNANLMFRALFAAYDALALGGRPSRESTFYPALAMAWERSAMGWKDFAAKVGHFSGAPAKWQKLVGPGGGAQRVSEQRDTSRH